jgi:osmotically-inducible protein OsmY
MLRKSDITLREEVSRELRWDTHVACAGLEVSVEDGVVTLRGEVPTYAKKVAAQEAAHRVTGVLDVVNDIGVTVNHASHDSKIARAVRDALEWDTLVPDERITSTVSDGWVTLEGEVENLRECADAERAVLNLRGVLGVVNKVRVRPQAADPEELRAQIEDALERRADREAERLRIVVGDGKVELWGRVHSWQERRAVVGSISHAPGVREVKDHLRVDPYF